MRFLLMILGYLTIFQTALAQHIEIKDLLKIHQMNDYEDVDAYLTQFEGWDCACYRAFDKIAYQKLWVYQLDTLEHYSDMETEHIKLSTADAWRAKYTTYFLTNPAKFEKLVHELNEWNFKEERIQKINKKESYAKLSFYVSDEVAIEVLVKRNTDKGDVFVLMIFDKSLYDVGFMVK